MSQSRVWHAHGSSMCRCQVSGTRTRTKEAVRQRKWIVNRHLIIEGHRRSYNVIEGHRRSWKVMEGQRRSRKVMDGLFPSLDWHLRWEKLWVWVGGGCVACRIIVSAPVPVPFLWTLDLGFGTLIWDFDLGLWFGTWIWDWTWAWQFLSYWTDLDIWWPLARPTD